MWSWRASTGPHSPEEVSGLCESHELTRVEGLRVSDVDERVRGVHHQRLLAEQWCPDILLVVVVGRPHDPQLIESCQEGHHICDGQSLVAGLRLCGRVHHQELNDLVAG